MLGTQKRQAELAKRGIEIRRVGNWAIECNRTLTDKFGDVSKKPTCSATIQHEREKKEYVRYGEIMFDPVFLIDERGLRLGREFHSEPCRYGPARIAVDGTRIDTLPVDEQIKHLSNGRVLLRERQKSWPHCDLETYGWYLNGAKAAYETMMQMWPKFAPKAGS
jgi:hypothetical protein